MSYKNIYTLHEALSASYCGRRHSVVTNRSVEVNWYQAVRIAQEVQILCERAAVSHYTYIAYLVCFIFLSIRNYMPLSNCYLVPVELSTV